MKRNRRLISVYRISHYWLIVVYRSRMGRKLWLRRNRPLIFFFSSEYSNNRFGKALIILYGPCIAFTSMAFQGFGSLFMDRLAPLFPKIYIILINYLWLRWSHVGRLILIVLTDWGRENFSHLQCFSNPTRSNLVKILNLHILKWRKGNLFWHNS